MTLTTNVAASTTTPRPVTPAQADNALTDAAVIQPTPSQTEEPTDKEMFARARSGDAEAVDLFWRRYYTYGLTAARRYTRSASDAEDLAAEAFTRILALLRQGRGPREHARTYIARTVRNVATDLARRREPTMVVIDEVRDVRSSHDTAAEALTMLDVIAALECLDACSPRQRYALYLTACEGRPIAEVAHEFDISANAAAALLVRGREAIRRQLARRTTDRASANRHRERANTDLGKAS
ncbi:RNA polymerase sigma factor [Cellulosimicrobium cellulans]|uniref:RNA polymerase sigma factor n=1 Tax=Cellulosimicrobium cellulans TaxID=1710 RepID=UPI003810ABE9